MVPLDLKRKFLELLEKDKEFQREIRKIVLTHDLMELPERFAKFEKRMLKFQEDMEKFGMESEKFRKEILEFKADTLKGLERIETVELAELKNIVSEPQAEKTVYLHFNTGWRKKTFTIERIDNIDFMNFLKKRRIFTIPNAVFLVRYKKKNRFFLLLEEASYRFDVVHLRRIVQWIKNINYPVFIFCYARETDMEKIKEFKNKGLLPFLKEVDIKLPAPLALLTPNYFEKLGDFPDGKTKRPGI